MAKSSKDASVAKIVELSASSTKSFEHAIENAISRANKTLRGITGAWVQDMKVDVDDGKVSRYRCNLKVTFILKD
jgi:dodecin